MLQISQEEDSQQIVSLTSDEIVLIYVKKGRTEGRKAINLEGRPSSIGLAIHAQTWHSGSNVGCECDQVW
jgi:hypothetical protein